MVRTNTIVLWDCGGKLEATLFASKRSAVEIVPVKDQMGMIAVKVSTTADFDEEHDYLLRQVNKNGRIEEQLIFGSLPRWAGGKLMAGRCIVASGADTTRLLKKYPADGYADKETRRLNGISNEDEDCCGK